jgi:hypothetical protein
MYKIQGADKEELTLHCLTMIDPVTGWFELLAEIPVKSAHVVIGHQCSWTEVAKQVFKTHFLMDRGREFMAEQVKRTLKHDYGIIQRKLITTRNPQANAMVERVHQTLHSMLATKEIGQGLDVWDKWEGILGAVGFAMRATVHMTTQATPMQLVFGRDAIHNVKFLANWQWFSSCAFSCEAPEAPGAPLPSR